MRKVFAILLALCLLCAFAACNRNNPPEPTDPTSDITETAPDTTPVIAPPQESEPGTEPVTTITTEPPTEPETTATEPAEKLPTEMSKAELVEYFNKCANRVRSERPGFTYEMTNKIANPKIVGGIASILNPVVPRIVAKLMPGDTEYFPMKRGQDNSEHFLSLQKATASSIKAGDVTSIQAAKSGTGYVITVRLGSATNPLKDGNSAYSRLFQIKTPKELLEEISGEDNKISGDYNNITLDYFNGNVVMTVDAQGRVTGLTGGFDVKAVAQDMKMYGFTVNFHCDQTSRIVAKDFSW